MWGYVVVDQWQGGQVNLELQNLEKNENNNI